MKKEYPFKKIIEVKDNKGWNTIKALKIVSIDKKFITFESHDGTWYKRTKETWKDTGIFWED